MLHYNASTDTYTLIIPTKVSITPTTPTKQFISLDPGVRTFMTGISDKELLHIGESCRNKIVEINKRIDRYNKIIIEKYQEYDTKYFRCDLHQEKRKLDRKIMRLERRVCGLGEKIKNLVTDMHNKTVNYLTLNYKHVLIGDMSPKSICSNSGENKLSKMTKRVIYSLSFYKFREKLKNKCISRGVGYKEVDERYTSKMCSSCGRLNERLKGSKVFECEGCGIVYDRDVNGARNIFLKQYFESYKEELKETIKELGKYKYILEGKN
jgi:putative transposase